MFGPDGSSRISRGVYENFLRACCTFRQRADSFDQWPAILSVGTLRVFGSCRSFAVLWNDTSVIGQSNHVVISFLDVFVVKRWRSRGRKRQESSQSILHAGTANDLRCQCWGQHGAQPEGVRGPILRPVWMFKESAVGNLVAIWMATPRPFNV